MLIRHLHKSKRVSKLQLAARSSMRCVAVGNGVGRGTVLLFHKIDRADSTLRNATPLAVMQVPAVSSRGTSHACALWLVGQLSVTDFRSAALIFEKFAVLRARAKKICGQDS